MIGQQNKTKINTRVNKKIEQQLNKNINKTNILRNSMVADDNDDKFELIQTNKQNTYFEKTIRLP